MAEEKKTSKEFSVSLKPATPVKSYELFLAKVRDGYLEVQLANRNETDHQITINVENIFRIPENRMYSFALEIISALPEIKKESETDVSAEE